MYQVHGKKQGHDLLSFSNSQITSIVAAALGVGMGLAGLYMSLQKDTLAFLSWPWVSELSGSSDIEYYVPGLQNLGNNCFLNVILQSLASCRYFSAYLQDILSAYELRTQDKTEELPLTTSLISLMEELCTQSEQRTVISPRGVMHILSFYVSKFQWTRQQDAAEALFHLLSSLGEENFQCYASTDTGLSNIMLFPSRIYKPRNEGHKEHEQWHKLFVGPSCGTIGSVLTCKTCSSMLSVEFEFFQCLPLSPLLNRGANIVHGCTVEDCLKHFTAVEHIENYRCDRCWHVFALRYLNLSINKDEARIKKLSKCVNAVSCECRSLFIEKDITWSGFSDAINQLSIARSPKILCLHLQRVSMNENGGLIKTQGRISFPLVLDLSPFMEVTKVVGQNLDIKKNQAQQKQQQLLTVPASYLTLESQAMSFFKSFGEKISSKGYGKEVAVSSFELPKDPSVDSFMGDCCIDSSAMSKPLPTDLDCPQLQPINEIVNTGRFQSPSYSTYHLCSVVEHYGRPGSGHYAVYRKVKFEPEGGNSTQLSDNSQWFYISDNEVSRLSEEAVLAAEASLLFYERIEAPVEN